MPAALRQPTPHFHFSDLSRLDRGVPVDPVSICLHLETRLIECEGRRCEKGQVRAGVHRCPICRTAGEACCRQHEDGGTWPCPDCKGTGIGGRTCVDCGDFLPSPAPEAA